MCLLEVVLPRHVFARVDFTDEDEDLAVAEKPGRSWSARSDTRAPSTASLYWPAPKAQPAGACFEPIVQLSGPVDGAKPIFDRGNECIVVNVSVSSE